MQTCAHCGASLADDQRYCLECGGRQVQARSQFLEGFTPAAVSDPAPPSSGPVAGGGGGRSSGATAVAGVGVLLLAMGVGVLIGRASGGKTVTEPAQVISVAAPGAEATGEATTPALTTSTGSSPAAGGTPKGSGSSSSSTNGKGSSSSSSSSSGSSKSSGGSSKTSTPKSKSSNGGESAEQKTRNIPNVVTTG